MVDLTERECRYELPPGIEKLEYPIPDFSFKPIEDVLVDVVLPVLERLKNGEKVLIHCRGGIGRSGVAVAMVLGLRTGLPGGEVKQRLARLGFVGETPSQSLAFRWFFRARDLAGVNLMAELVSRLKKVRRGSLSYWVAYGNHASTVANVALDVLEAIAHRFSVSKKDLVNAYAAGLLHDIGRVLAGEEDHHAAGAELARQLWESLRHWDKDVVSKAVYHHRRATNLLGDPELRSLGLNAQLVAAAVRLADAFDDVYAGEGYYLGTELRGRDLVLLLSAESLKALSDRLSEKAGAFSKLTGLTVKTEVI